MIFSRQKTFIGQVKALNKGENTDAQLIWKSFEGPKSQQNVSYFCLQLFEHVMHSQKKTYLLSNEERLYGTLLFIELYKNKKKKNPKLLEECSNFLQKMQPSLGKSLLIFLFSNQRQQNYGKFFISRLFMAPVEIDWQQSIQKQFKTELQQTTQYLRTRHKQSQMHRNHQSLKYQSYPLHHLPQPKILTFGYICFIDHIKKNNNEIKLHQYEHLISILKYLMNAVLKQAIVEELLVILIHFVIKCVTFYGCESEEVMKVLLGWAERLRCFFGVVGKMGGELFQILYDQLRIPGTAFRKKLKRDFPSLSIKENTFVNKQFFMITDQQQLYNRPQDLSLTTLRKLIIWNIIKTTPNLTEEEINTYLQFIKRQQQLPTFILYDKLIRILDVVSKLDSRIKIRQLLLEYVRKIMKETMKRTQNQGNNEIKQSIDKQALVQTQQFEAFVKKGNKIGYFPYPNFEIMSVPIADFISNKENVYNLSRIIQKNKADFQTPGFFKNKISLSFFGNGYSFLKFVNCIAKYLQTTAVQQAKQIQIFYIPRHDNICRPGIGLYIAHKDAWYRRFVYNIHYEKILYPHIDLNQQHKDLLPFYLYSKNVQLYLREANYYIPIRIYRCKLKMAEQEQEEVIYMSSYFSMGIFCEARIIKMQKQKQKNREEKEYSKELIEIIHEKLKKFPPMHIAMQVEILNKLDQTTKIKKQKDILIEDLQICNLPCQYFMGRQPNPSSPLLQMTILTENNAKIFKKEIGNNDNFKQNRPFDEIQQAFKDLFLCRTIKSITIENMDSSRELRVMIDGNFANKIQRVRIQPAISVSGVPITLQVQCFLPL